MILTTSISKNSKDNMGELSSAIIVVIVIISLMTVIGLYYLVLFIIQTKLCIKTTNQDDNADNQNDNQNVPLDHTLIPIDTTISKNELVKYSDENS